MPTWGVIEQDGHSYEVEAEWTCLEGGALIFANGPSLRGADIQLTIAPGVWKRYFRKGVDGSYLDPFDRPVPPNPDER